MKKIVLVLLCFFCTAALFAAANDQSFLLACEGGNVVMAASLLNSGSVAVDVRDGSGRTALMLACDRQKLAVVRLLLNAGADVNAFDKYGRTALINAAGGKNAEIIKLLLAAGARQTAENSTGWTPLMTAALFGSGEVASLLLEAEPAAAARSWDGSTALMYAAQKGKTDVMAALVGAGADVNALNDKGQTALMLAAADRQAAAARFLLDAGADRTLRDAKGNTAADLVPVGNADLLVLFEADGRADGSGGEKAGAVRDVFATDEIKRLDTVYRNARRIALLAASAAFLFSFTSRLSRKSAAKKALQLWKACEEGDREAVAALLAKDADLSGSAGLALLNLTLEHGYSDVTALLFAAKKSQGESLDEWNEALAAYKNRAR